jgi:hypothetical protein
VSRRDQAIVVLGYVAIAALIVLDLAVLAGWIR